MNSERCPICQRFVPDGCWERHHLIPRSCKGKETLSLCNSCGDMVHRIFSLQEMKTCYNTLEIILAHPDVQKWVKWVNKHPFDFQINMRRKKKK